MRNRLSALCYLLLLCPGPGSRRLKIGPDTRFLESATFSSFLSSFVGRPRGDGLKRISEQKCSVDEDTNVLKLARCVAGYGRVVQPLLRFYRPADHSALPYLCLYGRHRAIG